VAQCFQ
jgi:hypothetical protein